MPFLPCSNVGARGDRPGWPRPGADFVDILPQAGPPPPVRAFGIVSPESCLETGHSCISTDASIHVLHPPIDADGADRGGDSLRHFPPFSLSPAALEVSVKMRKFRRRSMWTRPPMDADERRWTWKDAEGPRPGGSDAGRCRKGAAPRGWRGAGEVVRGESGYFILLPHSGQKTASSGTLWEHLGQVPLGMTLVPHLGQNLAPATAVPHWAHFCSSFFWRKKGSS